MSETTGAALCRSGKEENMLQLLSGSQRTVDALGFLLAFALTALMDSVFRESSPKTMAAPLR